MEQRTKLKLFPRLTIALDINLQTHKSTRNTQYRPTLAQCALSVYHKTV